MSTEDENLERIALALERIAVALESAKGLDTVSTPRKRRGKAPRVAAEQAAQGTPIDETSRAAAQRALRKVGLG